MNTKSKLINRTERKNMTEQDQLLQIAQVSMEIVILRDRMNSAEKTARKARTALEMMESVHYDMVSKFKRLSVTPP